MKTRSINPKRITITAESRNIGDTPLIPEIVPSDPFRGFALSGRQYWMSIYNDARIDYPEMTLDEFLHMNWQNDPITRKTT